MNSKTSRILAVLTLTAVTALGVVGAGSAAANNDHGAVVAKTGDTWCC